ncbi:ATP-binding protein [soil metagenome]
MENFQVDLSNCDREPIHIPGKIQSHGFLLAYDATSGNIIFASNNLESFTGISPARALATPIYTFLAEQKALDFGSDDLRQLQASIELTSRNDHFINVSGRGRIFNIIGHKTGELIVLEFEPNDADIASIKLQDVISEIITPLQDGLNLNRLMPMLAKHIKNIIQYDRVMVYKFWDDWHGEVVAEDKNADLEPFLGLHYPASDIPQQARELYIANLVRIIIDVDATPTDLVYANPAMERQPLDLSHASLRAVSPMHIEYLRNMGVKASFSISLMYKGKLWGLVACHHYSPRFIDFESRQTCKLLAQLLSTTLNAKVDEELAIVSNNYKEEAERIFETLYRSGNVPQSLINNARSILKIGDARGAAITFEGKVYTIGETPSEEQIAELVKWVQRNAPTRLYQTNTLPKFYGKAEAYSEIASGLMAIELFKSSEEYVLWFKPELTQTVKWAGNPRKPIEVDTTGATRLTPRQSFAVWYEEVKHTSAPWERAEILTALRLREGILQVISQKANETRKLNEKLKEAYDELDTFSHTISHDLRTPISVIKNYAEILIEEYEQLAPDVAKGMLLRIASGADQMDELIKEVLAYSRLNHLDASRLETIEMNSLLDEIVTQAKDRSTSNTTVEIQDTPNVQGSKVIVQQIFANLIENAIKYTSKQAQPRIVVKGKANENEIIYQISDNGIGIDASQGDKVFMLFKRLDNAVTYEGTGIGLATVNRLIKKLGGRVWFESELNKGTVFFITFPLSKYNDKDN